MLKTSIFYIQRQIKCSNSNFKSLIFNIRRFSILKRNNEEDKKENIKIDGKTEEGKEKKEGDD